MVVGASPNEYRHLKKVMQRVSNVKAFREASRKEATRKDAKTPTLFAEIRQPKHSYVVIPRVTSEHRRYVPMGYLTPNHIISDSCVGLRKASLYMFGIMQSEMHMAWMKQVCGRLKSDFRYSNLLVYNNFPFPKNVSEKEMQNVEDKAKKMLSVRETYKNSSLADLYDPTGMPPDLVKAHDELDKAVDRCYGKKGFSIELERLEFLFTEYKKNLDSLTPTLF